MGENVENQGAESITKTKTEMVSSPSQFSGSNYAELEDFLKKEIAAYKPETPEEQQKREKREKRQMFLANIVDGLGTFHTAYSHARGVKPMELPNLSAKAQERFDKAKAEREKNKDRVINIALTLRKIKDSDRDFNFKVSESERQQKNWQTNFDNENEKWQKKFDNDQENWQKTFDENQRQFNVMSEETTRHNKASEGIQQERNSGSKGGSKDYTEFYAGSTMVKIPKSRMNDHNISYVFSKTPATISVGTQTFARPSASRDSNGKTIPLTTEQMLQWIGQNVANSDVQLALREIGGVTTDDDNTPPSRRTGNDNTPPSRRK